MSTNSTYNPAQIVQLQLNALNANKATVEAQYTSQTASNEANYATNINQIETQIANVTAQLAAMQAPQDPAS